MSDDQRPSRRDPDDFSEFGSLFDESPPTEDIEQVSAQRPAAIDDGWGRRTGEQPEVSADRVDAEPDSYDGYDHGDGYEGLTDDDTGSIKFDQSDTGSLPHWTEPPTGEVPVFEPGTAADDVADDEIDVWSSFSSESPVWKDDAADEVGAADDLAPIDDPRSSGAQPGVDRSVADVDTQQQAEVSGPVGRVSGPQDRPDPLPDDTGGQPARITIGTDPSGMQRREPDGGRPRGRSRRRGPGGPGGHAGATPARRRPAVGARRNTAGRDMPTAIAVGLVLAAAFIGALIADARLVVALVTIVLGLASVEFFGRVTEKGYRPAMVPGIATCIAAPLAAYWMGDIALPLVVAFGFMVTTASYAGAYGVDIGPLPNASVTTVGMIWIGLLGSFSMLILRFSTANSSSLEFSENWGTDTLFLVALGVVANDVGALVVGSAVGRTPLRPWISPNKTVEGLIGGTFFTLVVLVAVGVLGVSDTWSSSFHLLLLALVISFTAPLGDLVESMFKRNLDVKDFGTLVRGHGGVLDRFDGFLFVLPAAYYLTEVLEPWTKFGG